MPAVVFAMALFAGTAFAAHPLITDDTGTQGAGKVQLEFIGEYGRSVESGSTTRSLQAPTVPFFTCGLTDTTDLVLGLPYQRTAADGSGTRETARGAADASIELKWRFAEHDGWGYAIKPGIRLPTGNESKGLGNGRMSSSVFFIITKAAEPWAVHFNAGYVRNEYGLPADREEKRKDIWSCSLAAQVKVLKDLSVVANIGAERSPDKASDAHPAFLLGGLIYSLRDDLDIDIGLKEGLNHAEQDRSILAGITWRL